MGFADLGKQNIKGEIPVDQTITGIGEPNTGGGFSSLGLSPAAPSVSAIKQPLKTSAGLLNLAEQQGGTVAQAAQKIVSPEKSFLGKLSDTFKSGLDKTIKIFSIPSNVVAGILEPNKTVKEAIDAREMPSDVLIGDIKPETKLGKFALFVGKLAVDVLTDPLTYLTFGANASIFGIRAAVKVGGQTLTKAGEEFLQKGIEMGIKGGLSEDFVKEAMANMLKKRPELAKKFVDQGGIKHFGKTILSGQRIKTIIETVPIFKK